MESGKDLHHMQADRPSLGFRNGCSNDRIVGHDSLNEIHDIKGSVIHARVRAQSEISRHRYIGSGQGGNDSVFPSNIVGAFEHVSEWRPSQNTGGAGRVPAVKGQI
jgi:hypothetical protein